MLQHRRILNEFLATVGLGRDVSANPEAQKAEKVARSKAKKKTGGAAGGSNGNSGSNSAGLSRARLREWSVRGQDAVRQYFQSILTARDGNPPAAATATENQHGGAAHNGKQGGGKNAKNKKNKKKKKSPQTGAYLDLNHVLDVSSALSGGGGGGSTTSTPRSWKLEIGSGGGEWAAKQVGWLVGWLAGRGRC